MADDPYLAFPPTRKVLWDRLPRGPARHLCIDLWNPSVEVSSQALQGLAQRHLASRDSASTSLVARCIPQGRGHLRIVIDHVLDNQEELAADEWTITCSIRHSENSGASSNLLPLATAELREAAEAREARLEKSGPLCPGACLAWACALSISAQERRGQLQLWAEFPRWVFSLILLATPLRTLSTPLLADLLMAGRTASLGWGFLTLDLSRRVVCLHELDSLARRVPLVGVWVDLAGTPSREGDPVAAAHWDALEIADNPVIWAAAARFVHSRRVGERVWVDDGTFLLLVAHRISAERAAEANMEVCASFFEAHYDDSGGNAMLVAPAESAATFNLDTLTSQGSASCKQLPVRLMPMSEAPFMEDQPSNPEEDVPLNALGRAAVFNPGIPLRSSTDSITKPPSDCNERLPGYEVVQKLRNSDGKVDLTNLEEPRSIPPRQHPGPAKVAVQKHVAKAEARTVSPIYPSSPLLPPRLQPGLSETSSVRTADAVTLSHEYPRSPERVECSSSWHAVERTSGAPNQESIKEELNSPKQVSRASNAFASRSCEIVRLSDTNRELPQLLQAALGPYSPSPLIEDTLKSSIGDRRKEVTQPVQGLGTTMYGGTLDETKFLRDLVGMQQVQMMELQRQVSDLHSLVTGMASRRSCDLQQTSTPGGSSQITAELGATSGTVLEADVFTSSASQESRQPMITTADLAVGDSIELPATMCGRLPPHLCDAAVNTSFERLDLSTLLRQDLRPGAQSNAESALPCAEAVAGQSSSADLEPTAQPVLPCILSEASAEHGADLACSSTPLVIPQLDSRSTAGAASVEDADAVIFEQNGCTDSADTAGGGMPRKPPQVDGASLAELPAGASEFNELNHCRNQAMLLEVPRIIWSSSSSENSDFEDGEIASDAGSLDSAPVLGLALGLGKHRVAMKTRLS